MYTQLCYTIPIILFSLVYIVITKLRIVNSIVLLSKFLLAVLLYYSRNLTVVCKKRMMKYVSFLVVASLSLVWGFAPPTTPQQTAKCTALSMAEDKNNFDLMRSARAARSAGVDDRVVELKRPLGLVLDEDENGNVVVETVAPRGNAARTGLVRTNKQTTFISTNYYFFICQEKQKSIYIFFCFEKQNPFFVFLIPCWLECVCVGEGG